jgi:hypothetical protein
VNAVVAVAVVAAAAAIAVAAAMVVIVVAAAIKAAVIGVAAATVADGNSPVSQQPCLALQGRVQSRTQRRAISESPMAMLGP